MKKRSLFTCLAISLGMAASLSANPVKGAFAAYKDEFDHLPTAGEVDPASYFTNAWHQDVGARRISERGVVAVATSGWGQRGKFLKKYNVKDFSITVDVEKEAAGSGLLIAFTKTDGGYANDDNGRVLSFDIIKSVSVANLYRVTASTTLHNVSIPGFTDGAEWADDNAFTGVTVAPEDHRITISIKYIDEQKSEITVNGAKYQVSSADLYKNVTDKDELYLIAGYFNNTGSPQALIIESVGDAADEVYYSNEGTYGLVREGLKELKAVDYSTAEATVEAATKFDLLPYSKLYSFDQAYLQASYSEVKGIVDAAIEEHGDEVRVNLYELAVADLEEAAQQLTTVDEVKTAVAKAEYCLSLTENIVADELEAGLKTRYETAVGKYETANGKVLGSIKPMYEVAVADYEVKAAGVETALSIRAAYESKAQIPHGLDAYLATTDLDAFASRIVAADEQLKTKTTLGGEQWLQGMNADVIKQEDGSLAFYSHDSSMGLPVGETSGLYLKEELDASDFEMEFNINDIGDSTGSWLTIGLLEKPEMWINAETDAVQDNKGIFFLISRVDGKTLRCQAFLCSLRSNTFYDSVLNQVIEIPVNKDIKMSFKIETEVIAGVNMELFKMSFNEKSYDLETITAKKLKTVLTNDYKGHLMLATSGLSTRVGAAVTIKTINGYPAAQETSFVRTSTRPSSTSDKLSVKQGASENVNFNLDTKGLDIKSVKVNGEALDASNYSFANNTFVLNGAYVSKLAIGVYNIEVATDGGNVVWQLSVIKSGSDTPDTPDTPDKPAEKKGCGGSIIAASALISILSFTGFGLLISKKKRK